jgi:hypothetical protein
MVCGVKDTIMNYMSSLMTLTLSNVLKQTDWAGQDMLYVWKITGQLSKYLTPSQLGIRKIGRPKLKLGDDVIQDIKTLGGGT